MNQYDSSKIYNQLRDYLNYKLVDDYKKSDLVVLNTCAVRKKSNDKLFHFLGRLRKNIIDKSKIIVCVVGCVASLEKDKIFYKNDIVDIVCGPQSINSLYKLILRFKKFKKKILEVNFQSLDKNISNSNIFNKDNVKVSSYVNIIEGCNKFCSYCIVPYVRGKERSRNPERILEEICYLSKNGVCEINLLGQNVSAYKHVLGKKKYSFSNLLRDVSKIKEISRIRFTTNHPLDFNKSLINSIKNIKKIVNFLHLPIQSGSNKILRLMRRGYTVEYYKDLLGRILDVRPDMCFSSDFIVGFPGETDVDFIKTLDIVSELRFDHSYVFMYSPRPGTRSSSIIDNIGINEKKRRLLELKKIILENVFYWNKKMLGKIKNVLVEGYSIKDSNYLYGRTENNRKVYFLSKDNILGKIVSLKICKLKDNYLYGEIFG